MDSHKKIFCPLCEKNIPKTSKNSHKCNNTDRFLCELCTYESPILHNCIICKKTFSKDSHLKDHIYNHISNHKDHISNPSLPSIQLLNYNLIFSH